MAKRSDTARLEEVRTLLHQLQRIRSEPANSAPQNGEEANLDGALEGQSTRQSAFRPRAVRTVFMAGTALVLIACAVAGATLLLYKPASKNSAPTTAAIPQQSPSEPSPSLGQTAQPHADGGAALILLEQAQEMMLSGDVLGARATLIKSADSGPPDVALALARSYDPNFIRSLADPNAAPDVEEATLWYRRWHQAAVEKGQITDNLQLERILRAMR